VDIRIFLQCTSADPWTPDAVHQWFICWLEHITKVDYTEVGNCADVKRCFVSTAVKDRTREGRPDQTQLVTAQELRRSRVSSPSTSCPPASRAVCPWRMSPMTTILRNNVTVRWNGASPTHTAVSPQTVPVTDIGGFSRACRSAARLSVNGTFVACFQPDDDDDGGGGGGGGGTVVPARQSRRRQRRTSAHDSSPPFQT